jgi:DNA polymerase-3 subunit gamma/tau
MQYQALYRKYRPQRFDEVIGQDHVTNTLAREVIEGKVAHAYLLTGPRGTGKTTTARLLAKSLNCANRADDGEPDNTCGSCVAITNGSSLDVIELDAASNNKVEDVREIRINASTIAAVEGSRRVYILDEAHMLSRAAGNALLKILEEPPEHVIFVLATTEPYKLLDTIRSRAQRFDFHPVASETLIDYLDEIAAKEGFTTDRAALEAVAAHSGGSVRDAMSLLEQVSALGAGTVSASGVSTALGLASHEVFGKLVTVISKGEAAAGLAIVAELASRGADLRRFVSDAIAHFRGIFLAQYASNIDEVVDASQETIAEWKQQATVLSSGEVLRTIDELSDALAKLRDGREERLVVEIAIIRLTRPEAVESLEGLHARLGRIERDLADLKRSGVPPSGPAAPEAAPGSDAIGRPFPATSKEPTPQQEQPAPVAAAPEPESPSAAGSTDDASSPSQAHNELAEPVVEDPVQPSAGAEPSEPSQTDDSESAAETDISMDQFNKAWPAIMAEIRQTVGPRRQALLREAFPRSISGSTIIFEVAAHMHFHLEQLKADEGISDAIGDAAHKHLGSRIGVEFRSADAETPVVEAELQRVPDKDELLNADDDGAIDPVAVVADILNGQIIGE